MPSWNAFSYAFGPIIGFLGLGAMVLILRWAFRRGGSLVERPITPSHPSDYGLLVSVAGAHNYIEAEILRKTVEDAGIRVTLANTDHGPRIMVWPADEQNARQALSRGPGSSRGR
jgi:NADH:ubiquinone oxidoreductase subunit H